MNTRVFICMVVLSMFLTSYANIIKGTVVDSTTNAPVVNVKISTDALHYVFTDSFGRFDLNTQIVAQDNLLKRQQKSKIAWHSDNGYFTWTGYSGEVSIQIRNVLGRVVAEFSSKNGSASKYYIPNLSKGMYLATIKTPGQSHNCKIFNLGLTNENNLSQIVASSENSELNTATNTTANNALTFAKPGYLTTTKNVKGSPINLVVQINSNKLAKTSSAGSYIANQKVYETSVSYPYSLPGKSFKLIKIMDSNGRFTITSNSNLITSPADLVAVERKEASAKRKQNGALSDDLRNKIQNLKNTDSIKVLICLKIQPHTTLPLRTEKYSTTELKAMALDFIKKTPIVSKESILAKYSIKESESPIYQSGKESKNCPNLIIAYVKPSTLATLRYDNNIVSIEEVGPPKTNTVPTCDSCYSWGGSIWFGQVPCFKTLALSAFNPANSMPSDALGQLINVATWESGLRPSFLNCITSAPNDPLILVQIDLDTSTNGEYTLLHAEETFRCLTNAAPKANFYHHNATEYYDYESEQYIINCGLESISKSWSTTLRETPTDYVCRHLDLWTYVYPFPVFSTPSGNNGYCDTAELPSYNTFTVGNVIHYNMNHYVLPDTNSNCTYENIMTQTANPEPRYGGSVEAQYSCSSCSANPVRGDRELPQILAPGAPPVNDGNGGLLWIMADPCLKCSILKCGEQRQYNVNCEGSGTSYSAPILAGIAADVMSANWSLFEDPTAIRAILLLTAQNVDYENWSFHEDGRDGAGVVSGADAVAFAKTFVYATNNIAEINGLITGIYTADDTNGTYQDILVKIPDVIPSGKHLRAVLTWSSSPNEDDDYPVNDISDLDLGFRADYRYYYSSMSYDDNVEIVDIDNSSIIAGSEYTLIINLTALRIPPEATFQYFHYAVAWTWVKDHAE